MSKKVLYCISVIIIVLIYNEGNTKDIDYCKEWEFKSNSSNEYNWEQLKRLLIKFKKFSVPPSYEFDILENNKLVLYVYMIKEIKNKIGFWEINSKKNYLKIRIPGYHSKTEMYKSFKIECEKMEKMYHIMIFLCKDTIFKEPNEDDEEAYASSKYLILYHTIDRN